MPLPPIDLANIAAGTGGFVVHGQDAGDQAGFSLSSIGDINGDGFDDLLIGAPFAYAEAVGQVDAGESYVVFGSATRPAAAVNLASIAAGTGGFSLRGIDTLDQSGIAVAAAGDINGDGFADLIIGSRGGDGADNLKIASGESYVVFGRAGGFGANINLSTILAGGGTAGFVIHGAASGDQSGASVAAAGDVNGDGFDDLIIGAPFGAGPGNTRPGAGDSFVVFGKASGFTATIDLTDVAAGTGGFAIYGAGAGDATGFTVAGGGDVNGDGVADLVIGARYGNGAGDATSNAGNSYVVFGRTGPFPAAIDLAQVAAGTGGFVIHGDGEDDLSGWSVDTAGDFNGDGFADLIIGAYLGDAAANARLNAGDSYLVFGGASSGAPLSLANIAAGSGGFVIRGQDAGDFSGQTVAGAGDINADGYDDLIIGASRGAGAGNLRPQSGDSFVVFGTASGVGPSLDLATIAAGTGGFVIHGQDAYDASANVVAAGGDIDGDGFDDLLVGASRADGAGNSRNTAGDSYVVFGRDFTLAVSHPGSAIGETLTGSAAANDMVGGQGNDILLGNGGADVLIGGSGDDALHISDTGFRRVMGGTGTDTLVLDGSGIVLNLPAIADTALQSIERIDLNGSGTNLLAVTAQEVMRLSTVTNTLRVDGGADDIVSFSGQSWAQGATAGGYTTYTNGNATLQVDADIVTIPCFAEGTAIMTMRGEVAVEHLRERDIVLVVRGSAARRVRWIGHRRVRIAGHPRPWDVQPVRIAAHAFGPGRPHSTLRLSPDHAVFAASPEGGALVPVRYMINGTTIVQEQVDAVTYFHVELANAAGEATHDVLLAQGLPAESFLDTGNRSAFANGGATVMAHPDFARATWSAAACAPLVRDGEVLAALRTDLRARAIGLGHAITADPDLHLVVDGKIVRPDWIGAEYGFVLPDDAREVRLVSRTTVPAQICATSDDTRELGVAVTRLVLDGAPIALGGLAGWHDGEPGWRWTRGDALLPCAGGCVLEVSLPPLQDYWLPATTPCPARLTAA